MRRLDHLGTAETRTRAHRILRSDMLSLPPVTREVAMDIARREATSLLREAKVHELLRLILDVSNLIAEKPEVFAEVSPQTKEMSYDLRDALGDPASATRREIDIAAVFSDLRNPFDGSFVG